MTQCIVRYRPLIQCVLLTLLLQVACEESAQEQRQPMEASDAGNAKEGHFSGVIVSGLHYRTATEEGTTDSQGTFAFRDDEKITFSVGELAVGSVDARAELTLKDLVADAGEAEDRRFDNLLVLLTSLDRDGQLNTGIEIDRATREIRVEVQGQDRPRSERC